VIGRSGSPGQPDDVGQRRAHTDAEEDTPDGVEREVRSLVHATTLLTRPTGR